MKVCLSCRASVEGLLCPRCGSVLCDFPQARPAAPALRGMVEEILRRRPGLHPEIVAVLKWNPRLAGPPVQRPDLPPDLPRYLLLELLGRGAVGEVWKAWDFNISKYAAIKKIHGEFDPADVEQFLEEGTKAARLKDRHIVQIYDVGLDAGRPYVVMEYVDGENLGRSRPRDPLEAARLIRDAAGGLVHAHEQRLIHRDLKPENIMRSREGAGDVLVADFGLASLLGGSMRRFGKGETSKFIGTPEYMSPEQATPGGKVDERTDVFGLGATLYDLLAGRPPFEGATWRETVAAAARGEVKPVRSLRPDCPKVLARIVERAMAPDRAKRYPTMRDFHAALTRFLERRKRMARLRKLALGLLAAGLLAGAVLGVRELSRWTEYRGAMERALASEACEDWDAAVEAYEIALRSTPGDARAGAALARARRRLGLFEPDGSLAVGGRISSLTFGSTLVVGLESGEAQFWDIEASRERPVKTLSLHPGGVRALARVGALLVSGGGGTEGRIAVTDQEGRIAYHDGHPGGVLCLALSPDGRRLASAGGDGRIKVWDAARFAVEASWKAHEKPIRSVAFAPDGATLASAGDDARIRLWGLDGRGAEEAWYTHGTVVRALAFSRDGRRLISAFSDNYTTVWDFASKERRADLTLPKEKWQHTNYISSMALSPGGRLLATAGGGADESPQKDDTTVRLWDFLGAQGSHNRPLEILRGHRLFVAAVAFHPGGDLLASGGRDGTVRLWRRPRWRIETRAWLAGAPAATSVTRDSRGAVHASWLSEGGLVYGTDAAGQWESRRIDNCDPGEPALWVDAGGKAHVAYSSRRALRYATNREGRWRTEAVPAPAGPVFMSICALPDGAVTLASVSYARDLNHDLDLSTRSPDGRWQTARLVAGNGTIPRVSMALDAKGELHMCYTALDDRQLHYVRGTLHQAHTDEEISHPQLAVDGEGHAHVAYWTDRQKALKYASNRTGAWAAEAIATSPDVAAFTVAPGAVAFVDPQTFLLRRATRGPDSEWTLRTVDTLGTMTLDLWLDGKGLVYYDPADGALRAASPR